MNRRHPVLLAIPRGLVLLFILACVAACGDEREELLDEADAEAKGLQYEDLVAAGAYPDAGKTRISFADRSADSGLTGVNHSGRDGEKEYLIEAVGPGPAVLDYNGDGLMDYFVPEGDVLLNYELVEQSGEKGRLFPFMRPKDPKPEPYYDQLWRNNGDGTFTDVAKEAGLVDDRWSFGATALDYDGDGDTDLFVANFGADRLWRNNGDGTFTDVAEELNVAGDPRVWSTCAAAGDVDGDGRLDLYIAAYADPAAEVSKQRAAKRLPWGSVAATVPGRACRWRGMLVYCGPVGLAGQHDRLLRQQEDGTFLDVTKEWGLIPPVSQYGFTVGMVDFNDDGLLDIYVANDSVENFMWQQYREPDGRIVFRDTSDTLGVKYGHGLNAQASMGMAIADIDQDGLFDILVTNFSHDYNNIYKGKRVGDAGSFFFKDRGLKVMGQPVYLDLSWGAGWFDFDNDRDLDLYIANGHVYAEIDHFTRLQSKYFQYNALFECMEPARMGYREIGTKAQQSPPSGVDPANLDAGDGMAVRACSRAATFGDYDNDGRVDIIVGNLNRAPTLLMNTSVQDTGTNWVKLSLRQSDGNRDALGASVYVEAGERKQRFPILRCSSFLGSNDPRLHVGLGDAGTCEVTVTWPGAERTTTVFRGLEAGKHYVLDRDSGEATPQALPVWK